MTFLGVVQGTRPTWLYPAAMDIFRVTNIPNTGGKGNNLLFSCPEIGSQTSSFQIMALSGPPTVTQARGHQATQAELHPAHPQEQEWKKDTALLGEVFRKINSKGAAH